MQSMKNMSKQDVMDLIDKIMIMEGLDDDDTIGGLYTTRAFESDTTHTVLVFHTDKEVI